MSKEPVTVSGYYEHTDGTVGKYAWRDGRLECDSVAPSWGDATPEPTETEMLRDLRESAEWAERARS